ncbi:leucine-rich repeat domain-containing protein [Demequina sp. NBRC 110056]|uniref:leucine-rich repeat domain-containing protein n=1 Tax=Demequina sp. NBRC 110056 TaxID=1570345 RepID=UPI000A0540B3|nr:leucine-rich repeat protein [Demequina sp. NBRC 110056]
MPTTSSTLRSAAAATLVAGLLVAAPVVGGTAGAAARAQEPDAPPTALPSDIVSADIVSALEAAPDTVDVETAQDDEEPAVVPSEDDSAEHESTETAPAEPVGDDQPGEDAATEAAAPAGGAEPADADEPADASAPEGEPSTDEPSGDEASSDEEPATASALQAFAGPVPLVEGLEEAPGLPTFVGADGCTYSYIEQEGSIDIADIVGCTDVVVPEEIDGAPVERLGAGSSTQRMTDADVFTSLVLPDSLLFVGQGAFSNADALVSVDFGSGVQRILGRAFVDADALQAVVLPPSVQFVGARAFENTASLATIDLGSVETVEGLAFSGAGKVTELVVPASITRAADTAFGNMPQLRSLLIEGDPTALVKHTFFNSPSLEEAEFRSRSTSATIVNTMFVGANQPKVFFRDGAFGKSCGPVPQPNVLSEERFLGFGGTQVRPRCLFDVTIDPSGSGLSLEVQLSDVREGTILTDVPEPVAPSSSVEFVGYSPSVEEPVIADTHYVAQFAQIQPGDYTPSEDDLVDEAQGGFTIPGTVQAGEELTLTVVEEPNPGGTPEPNPGGTQEPNPGGTLEPNPGGTPAASVPTTLEQVPELELPEDEPEPPAEDFDPNEFIDVVLFSEPVELAITGFVSDPGNSLITVLVPADTEPGEHKLAVYSVFGELLGWQPLTVTAAPAPPAPPGGEVPGEVPGETPGEVPGDEDGGAPEGDTDGDAQPVATPVAAETGGADGELSDTGAPETGLAIGAALALIAVGTTLIVGRRLRP